jgi:hypothetical protein
MGIPQLPGDSGTHFEFEVGDAFKIRRDRTNEGN